MSTDRTERQLLQLTDLDDQILRFEAALDSEPSETERKTFVDALARLEAQRIKLERRLDPDRIETVRASRRLPQEIIDRILDEVPKLDAYARFVCPDLTWRDGQKEARGTCPACGNARGKYHVNAHTGLSHCFVCLEGSNLLKSVMRYGSMGFREAMTALGELAGIHVPEPEPWTPPARARREEPGEEPISKLPTIYTNHGQLRDLTDQTLAALVARNNPPRLYLQGDALVRLAQEPARLKHLGTHALIGEMARAATWLKTSKKEDTDARPPRDVAEDILSLPALTGFPPLQAVLTAPCYSGSGRLLLEPGYHPDPGIWLALGDLVVPPVPDRPTAQDLDRARELLLEPLADFPLAESASRAHAVAMMLLPFGRDLIAGPTPMHQISSPTQGSGKGLLLTVAGIIATGHPVPATSWPTNRGGTDEAELRKSLFAHLADGAPAILIDNIPTGMDSGTLAAMLTAIKWTDRVLTTSRTATVSVRCLWASTAINPSLTGELARRCISIRLEPQEEAPWERSGWRHPDLVAWVREHRAELVWAALVAWQAWLAAGKPRWTGETMGSYERWTETMGSLLELLGILGLLGNRQDMWASTETELPELRALAEHWYEAHGERPVRVTDLVQLCCKRRMLADLLQGRRDKSKSLGRWLRRHDGRVISIHSRLRVQMRLGTKDRTGVNQWRLARLLGDVLRNPALPAQTQQQTLQAGAQSEAVPGESAGFAGSTSIPPVRVHTHTHGRAHACAWDGITHSPHSQQTLPEPCQGAVPGAGMTAGRLPATPCTPCTPNEWTDSERDQLEGLL